MKKLISTVLCLFILLSCILPAMAATGVPEEVMESTKSVVRILSKYYNGAATGSGFVIKNEPGEVLIATNDHVVEGNPTSISIWVGEDRMVDAEIVFTTSEKDLCVLKVTDEVDMKPLKLSKEEPQHGAAIYVVGYPGAGDILSDTQAHTSESVTITDGIISAIRSFTIEKGGNPVKLLQVNAAINSGNSGGPLFNTEGVVVGVNTYKVNADSQGVFGSVDISELWSLLNQYGIEIPDEPEIVEAVTEESSFPMPALIGVGIVCLVLTVILIAKRRKKNTPQRKRKNSKIQTVTLQAHMEKYPQGLGVGGAVSLLLSAAVQLRNLHNDGKLHLQICPENILIGADGASLKEPSSQETGRFNSGFAAPEIYRGAGFGITSDIYSFAAVLLYVATGKVPANSLQQDALEQDFSLLDDVIFAQITRKAMASNILDRTQSMQELIYSIAVYNAPVQERQSQPLRTVETVPVSISEERTAPAPVKEEQVKIPKHRKKTVPKKKHRKLLPIAAVLVCGIVAVVLLLKPAAKQDGSVELQSTEQTQTTIPVAPEEMAYNEAEQLLANGETAKAAIAFGKLAGYKDARERSFALWAGRTICVGNWYAIAVKQDGTVVATGQDNRIVSDDIRQWKDIVTIDSGNGFAVGLKCDGTVVANYANNAEHADVHNVISEWEDIVAIRTGGPRQTIGLQSDGTLVTTASGQIKDELSQWKNIIEIDVSSTTETSSPGSMGVIGLRDDGTVALYRDDEKLQEEWQKVKNWTDIVSVRTVGNHVMGIKSDGTVMIAGWNTNYLDAVSKWTDIVDIDGGKVEQGVYIIGLKADGTTVTVGDCGDIHKTLSWNSIVELEASDTRSISNVKPVIGLKSDGTVVVIGIQNPRVPYFDFSEFQNIRVPNSPNRNRNETKPEEAPTDQQGQYDVAEKLLADGETAKAAIAFGKLGDYRDARARSFALWDKVTQRDTISVELQHTVAVKNDGTVLATGNNQHGQCNVDDWSDIIAISAGFQHTVGLKADGTVVATGSNDCGQCDVIDWRDIVAIHAKGTNTVGLKSDGTVVVAGWNREYYDVSALEDIIAVQMGFYVVGLRDDGTTITDSSGFYKKNCDVVNGWTDIVTIRAHQGKAVGIKADGSVVENWQKDNNALNSWSDIIAVDFWDGDVGLRSDGTVVTAGAVVSKNIIEKWTDIVSIAAGNGYTIGLKANGTVVAAGNNKYGRCNVSDWTDIKLPTGSKAPKLPAAMGATVQNLDGAVASATGAYVVSVEKGRAAERAGIQVKDIILRLEEYEITNVTDLTRALRNFYAGDTAEIVVSRSGEEITLEITFDAK